MSADDLCEDAIIYTIAEAQQNNWVWASGRSGVRATRYEEETQDTPARKHAHTQKDYSSHSPTPPTRKQ
jgi:hypothetical protein